MVTKTYSITEKKVLKWSQGYGVFITIEAKKFGWDPTTKVRISAIEDKNGKKIVIEEA